MKQYRVGGEAVASLILCISGLSITSFHRLPVTLGKLAPQKFQLRTIGQGVFQPQMWQKVIIEFTVSSRLR